MGPKMTRRTALAGALAGAMTAAVMPSMSMAAPSAGSFNGPPCLFVSPHADDELLFMGPAIMQHLDANREVYTMLASDGTATYVLGSQKLKDLIGYTPRPPEMTCMRNKEYIESCRLLGVAPSRSMISRKLVKEGRISVRQAEALWNFWLNEFNGEAVDCKTMSWTDPHPDHAALGQALKNMVDRGDPRIYGARWSVKPFDKPDGVSLRNQYGTPVDISQQEPYRRQNPPENWGVGYMSVPYHFDDQIAEQWRGVYHR